MEKDKKTVIYDKDLDIEIYHFKGLARSFINHFHDYWVIGNILKGNRVLSCKNKEYILKKGDTVIFNPNDIHSCTNNQLYYIGINIKKETMQKFYTEFSNKKELPYFSKNVVTNKKLNYHILQLYKSIIKKYAKDKKEKIFASFLAEVFKLPCANTHKEKSKYEAQVNKAKKYIEKNYKNNIKLEDICKHCSLAKSTLLRAFLKASGTTPYNYLENIRIFEAKRLLEKGVSPIETAFLSGFFDQSHFTNYFNKFIGLTPKSWQKFNFKKENK